MSPRPHTHVHSPLAEALQPSVGVCEATIEAYRGEAESGIVAAVVLALAGLERAVESSYGDPTHDASLLIAASLCREAARSIRRHGLDATLLRCADACERAARICEADVGNA